jgi:hypothetical protein
MRTERLIRRIAGHVVLPAVAYAGLLVAAHPEGAAGLAGLSYPWANHLVEGGLLLAFVSLLGVLGRLLAHVARAGRRWAPRQGEARSTRATVMVEFVLVLPILLTLIAMVVQIALLANAALIVRYAAFCAARSAIVRLQYPNLPPEQRIGDEPEKVALAAQLILAGISPAAAAGDDPAARTILEIHRAPNGPWGSRQVEERMTYAQAATRVDPVVSAAPLVPEFPDDVLPPWARSVSSSAGLDDIGEEITRTADELLGMLPDGALDLVALPQVEVTVDYDFLLTLPGIWGFLPGVEDAPAGVSGKAFKLTQKVRLQSIGARESSPIALLPFFGNSPLP